MSISFIQYFFFSGKRVRKIGSLKIKFWINAQKIYYHLFYLMYVIHQVYFIVETILFHNMYKLIIEVFSMSWL